MGIFVMLKSTDLGYIDHCDSIFSYLFVSKCIGSIKIQYGVKLHVFGNPLKVLKDVISGPIVWYR